MWGSWKKGRRLMKKLKKNVKNEKKIVKNNSKNVLSTIGFWEMSFGIHPLWYKVYLGNVHSWKHIRDYMTVNHWIVSKDDTRIHVDMTGRATWLLNFCYATKSDEVVQQKMDGLISVDAPLPSSCVEFRHLPLLSVVYLNKWYPRDRVVFELQKKKKNEFKNEATSM